VETAAACGHRLVMASRFMGKEPRLLEARRRELFDKQPGP
jgi:predicted metallo-beta-lactamase superfamily hydrolase